MKIDPHPELTYLNHNLNEVEESIINLMRLNSPKTFEIVHGLIGERENIKGRLKDIHKELYA